MIQAGQRYKLSGLAAAHLNGKTCKIRRYDEEKKRWIVDLDADLEKNNDAPKALRAENLKPITEPPLGGPSTPPPAAAQQPFLPELRPNVTVRYRALKRGTFARVQPVKAAFAKEIGDVKGLLERELHYRTHGQRVAAHVQRNERTAGARERVG